MDECEQAEKDNFNQVTIIIFFSEKILQNGYRGA